MRVAIIPARGGSKRIPHKNIQPFCGKPLIAYPIASALATGLFDQVVVSTDDEAIKEVALSEGAVVPFLRPAELSDDYTGTMDVYRHAIQWLQHQGHPLDVVCCLYATTPLLEAQDLVAAHTLFTGHQSADYCFGVVEFGYPIQRGLVDSEGGGVKMLHPEHASTRSQDLPRAFHDAGQFYWGRANAFIEGRPMFGDKSLPYFLPRERAIDIDTPADWQFAEKMYQLLNRK